MVDFFPECIFPWQLVDKIQWTSNSVNYCTQVYSEWVLNTIPYFEVLGFSSICPWLRVVWGYPILSPQAGKMMMCSTFQAGYLFTLATSRDKVSAARPSPSRYQRGILDRRKNSQLESGAERLCCDSWQTKVQKFTWMAEFTFTRCFSLSPKPF